MHQVKQKSLNIATNASSLLVPVAMLSALVSAIPGANAAEAEKKAWRSPESVAGAITTTAEQAKKLFDDGAVFIDVRNPRYFARSHIPGAHHLDFKVNFDEQSLAAVASKDQPLVIYCSGVKCSRSYKASAKAVSWGYTTVHYFRGGIVDWKAAGYRVNWKKATEPAAAE